MALSTDVKWITNTMRGAPVVNGNTPGCLIAALDALLVTGWGTTTALSVSVSGGIATATVNAGSSFAEHAVVRVDGATPAALNGDARVLTASNTQITFATVAPDGVATGTITIKYAPAGWEKPFAGTNKAVYRSADVTGARFCYRIDDAGTTYARIRGYESMTDIDAGVGPCPTDAQISGGGYLFKSYSANGTAVPYFIAADSRTVLIGISGGFSLNVPAIGCVMRGFGDMISLSPSGDIWSAAVSCQASTSSDNTGYGAFSSQAYQQSGIYVARSIAGIGSSVLCGCMPFVGERSTGSTTGADSTLGAFPSAIDGQLKIARRYITHTDAATPRAIIPGALHIPQSGVLNLISDGVLIDGGGEFAGRKLRAFATVINNGLTSTPVGVGLVDVTGPWRW